MLSRVKHYITEHHLIPSKSRVLTALSGGSDSFALLHILASLRDEISFSLEAIFIDHGTRTLSDKENSYLLEQCQSLEVPLRSEKINDICPKGESWEAWARRKRHEIFTDLVQREKFCRVALGHHRDDQVETLFIKLFRGAGLRGLCGMRPLSRGFYIRPLLCLDREEINGFLRQLEITPIEDPSNQDQRFLRNRIRHNLIPSFSKKYSASLTDTILATQSLLQLDEDFMSRTAGEWLQEQIISDGEVSSLPRQPWRALHPAIRMRVLLGYMDREGVDPGLLSTPWLADAENRLMSEKNCLLRVTGTPHTLAGECDTIHLVSRRARLSEPVELSVPGSTAISPLRVTVHVERGKKQRSSLRCVVVPLPRRRLSVQTRKGGEIMRTETGLKKVKRVLKELNVPCHVKDNLPLVFDGEHVIWIPDVAAPCERPADDQQITLRWELW